mmetsp:Transcript_5837/g.7901  ORF Transcript_5837/g.7901 Transcript_5837/m.7901 type:complete len:92 (-) Transcript_5837:397-672(-)|eukprot:CAMPEP_0185621030 /NCGR_PEP_ID=MMETSP0436-20130131/55956_1 /TAXON_ID=626734 ORGANISM="Favella taraikaensis, Strain Fe Narragansett Bay" /NCGR_SAMPLE_ID=MMETSP0436 /ASSEMBLY_ACC=CAM_ASM_000390 /LENGTH=91 /DNA_ID=CAMNT_0028261903 /DNA_START=213 /DNA_END=488 /DNA_ORIENTATION=+
MLVATLPDINKRVSSKHERAMALYNLRSAHHDTKPVPSGRQAMTEQDEMLNREEIFNKAKLGPKAKRKKFRDFINHSSCEDFNILTNEPKQ